MKMLNEKDLMIDTFSTPNGELATIRITHLPTGHSVECSVSQSQTMNKHFALGMLTERVNQTPGDCPWTI
jgi:protein subunit release factor A